MLCWMIENFNDNFREICLNLKIDKRRFILGLSGGIDSMALLSLLKHFIVSNKNLIPFVISSTVEEDLSKFFLWDSSNKCWFCPGAGRVIPGAIPFTLMLDAYESADIVVRPCIACLDKV